MSPHLPCSRQLGATAMRRFVLISFLVAYCAVLGALFLASYRFTPIEYHSYVGAAWMLLLIAIILCVRLYRRFAKGEVLALDGLIVMSVYLASLAAMAVSAFFAASRKSCRLRRRYIVSCRDAKMPRALAEAASIRLGKRVGACLKHHRNKGLIRSERRRTGMLWEIVRS